MRYIFKLHPDVMLPQICEVTSGTPITIRIRRLRYLPVQGCTRIPVLLDWSRTTTGTLLRKGNLACRYVADTSVVCDKEFLVSKVLAYTVTTIIRIASYFTHEKCSVYVRIVCMCMYCCWFLLVLTSVVYSGIHWKGNNKVYVSAACCTCRSIPRYISVLHIRMCMDYWFQDDGYLSQ